MNHLIERPFSLVWSLAKDFALCWALHESLSYGPHLDKPNAFSISDVSFHFWSKSNHLEWKWNLNTFQQQPNILFLLKKKSFNNIKELIMWRHMQMWNWLNGRGIIFSKEIWYLFGLILWCRIWNEQNVSKRTLLDLHIIEHPTKLCVL